MYYQPGWQAYLDGEKVEHVRANYLLRAMNIPAGEHTVTFRFEPEVVNTGSSIALASSIILVLIILGGFSWKKKHQISSSSLQMMQDGMTSAFTVLKFKRLTLTN